MFHVYRIGVAIFMGDWSKEAMSGLKWTAYLWPILSGICLGFGNMFLLSSLAWADASKAVGIESIYPLFVIIWSYFFLEERIAPLAYLGMFFALAGSIVLSFDILKSMYASITAKYPRFKKYHEHFVLVEKEKHESMAKDAAKKSSNKYYGRCWYPFIKKIDEYRMKNYSGSLHDLIESGSANTFYYKTDRRGASRDQYEDSDSGSDEEGGGDSGNDKKNRHIHDPYMAPDLVYMEGEDDDDEEEEEEMGNMEGVVEESDGEEYGKEYYGTDNERSEEMGTFAADKRRKRRKKKGSEKKKKHWALELISRNRRVITGLLPIPLFMSGNDFFAKLSVDGLSEDDKAMPANNVSAINTVCFGLVLVFLLLKPRTRKHFLDEFRYNVMFAIFIEALSVFTNYLMIIAMSALDASIVSSLSSTRPFFILIFEKMFRLSKDSVQQIAGFKLLPIIFIIAGSIIMTVLI